MDTLLIIFLTLLNGAFAMSEMSLAASRKARLAAMAEAGDKGSQAALKLLEHPTQFLSSVQVGITSIGMLNGIVGEAAFSGGVADWLEGWGMTPNARPRAWPPASWWRSSPSSPSCSVSWCPSASVSSTRRPWRAGSRGP